MPRTHFPVLSIGYAKSQLTALIRLKGPHWSEQCVNGVDPDWSEQCDYSQVPQVS